MMSRPPKSKRQYVKNSLAKIMANKFKGIVAGPMPAFVEPALATLRRMMRNGFMKSSSMDIDFRCTRTTNT
jgi:hypothetical protein